MPRTLLIGAGQIGRAIAAELSEPPTVAKVPWADPPAAGRILRRSVSEFLDEGAGEQWTVCWSAGRGVVGTPEEALRVEASHLDEVLGTVLAAPAEVLARGRVALISSAGGVHGSSSPLVCTERTPPTPASGYGISKLRQEQAVRAFSERSGVPCLVARVSNVYGPGQDLSKPQGFVSHLCRAMLRREPFVLTVPPDTVRDFIFGRDVGRRVASWLNDPLGVDEGVAEVKLVVAGRSTTLLEVIATVRAIARVPSRITVSSRRDGAQPARTRFRSVNLQRLDVGRLTPLQEGVLATWQWTLRSAMLGRR